jgi:hypothetical protein
MAIEAALTTKLQSITALAAITTRIRPYRIHQTDDFPSIAILCDGEVENNDLSGTSGLVDGTFRIRCMSNTIAGARAMADALRGTSGSGLAGFSGTVSSVAIQAAYQQRRVVGFYPFNDAGDEGIYYVDGVYLITYTETP